MADYLGYTFVDAQELIAFNYDGTTDEDKIQAKVDEVLKKYSKIVVPGFYGSYPDSQIKLLSRGGSDVTGSILAKASNADIYENWTDVSGFLMADPRIVKKPKQIASISYKELRELSYMGASVLHEDAIYPARMANVPINIRNTNRPNDDGTIITSKCTDNSQIITGIAGKKNYESMLNRLHYY